MTEIIKKETLICNGEDIVLLRLTNSSGAYVELTNLGAAIVSVVVPDKHGKPANVVLSYDKLSSCFSGTFYLGSTVGRYANRISNAAFELDGTVYNLDKNDGENSNHGGFSGFNRKVFGYSVQDDNVIFSLKSDDGEGGFPGNLDFRVIYSFSDDNELLIQYKGKADKLTPVNFTNHAYFNLSGGKNSILNDCLQINASRHLEMGADFLPTGKILPVDGTAFDFRSFEIIGEKAGEKQDNLQGYNAYFIKNNPTLDMPVASVVNIDLGRRLDVYTSMPGVMFYTAEFLSHPFIPFQGICLEAQYHPDGVNHSHFETCILSPDIEKVDVIKYHFRCKM